MLQKTQAAKPQNTHNTGRRSYSATHTGSSTLNRQPGQREIGNDHRGTPREQSDNWWRHHTRTKARDEELYA